MPNPTQEQIDSPEFEAVWQAIKTWDVNVPESYKGYCGANGSHVALILNALATASDQRAKDLEEATREFIHAQAVLTGDPVRAKRAGDRLVELGVIEESEPR